MATVAFIPHSQTFLRLGVTWKPFEEETEIVSAKLKYRTPANKTGEFGSVTIDVENRKVFTDLETSSPLAKKGDWYLWVGFTMTDGRYLPCKEPVKVEVIHEGYEV